jgi:hypothetical protein
MMSITAAGVDHSLRVDAAAAGAPLRSVEPRHNKIYLSSYSLQHMICDTVKMGGQANTYPSLRTTQLLSAFTLTSETPHLIYHPCPAVLIDFLGLELWR